VVGTTNTLGSNFTWAPQGKLLCTSVYNAEWDCAIYLVPVDPLVGNGLSPFSHPPFGQHDYDPNWSPLGDQIVWERRDLDFYTKGVPGHSPDTLEHQVPVVSSLLTQTDMSLSPDGSTIAFSGASLGPPSIYTVPLVGGAPSRLTSDPSVADDFPQWAPDGKTIVFFRSTSQGFRIYQVAAADTTGHSLRAVAAADTGLAPSFGSDGRIIVYSHGAGHVLSTLDSAVTSGAAPVPAYPLFTTALMVPKFSPDGTRLALRASPPNQPSENPQLWATRRNMSLPPNILSFGGQSIADTTAVVPVSVIEGLAYSGAITASDPEGDPIAFSAFFLQQAMSFDVTTGIFSWIPPSGTAGRKFNIRFLATTPNGGLDAVIVQLTVAHASASSRGTSAVAFRIATSNPVNDRFVLQASGAAYESVLDICDAAGRRVARQRAAAGAPMIWNLRTPNGTRVKPGVYFYRATSGAQRASGRFVVTH
jgi:dipeptidyl aminopeptidase/acylaminoacyl peptidase